MEIKHIDGSVTDTNKLSDIKAMQMERIQAFIREMESLGVPMFLTFRLDCNSYCGGWNVPSMCGQKEPEVFKELIQDTVERCEKIISDKMGEQMRFVLMNEENYENLQKNLEDDIEFE